MGDGLQVGERVRWGLLVVEGLLGLLVVEALLGLLLGLLESLWVGLVALGLL